MKLSVAIADTGADDSAFVVWRGFEESFKKASGFGYHGVELALKRASDINVTDLENLLKKNCLEVSCISTGQVFSSLGLYFTHPDKKKRDETISIFKDLVDLASKYGKLINVGRARGFYNSNQTKKETEDLFIEVSQIICDYAEPKGVTLMIEPVNRYEINFVNSVIDAVILLKKIDRKNISVMPDVFHMNIEDQFLGSTLGLYGKYIDYVHLADSNRLAPGLGHLDFDDIFNGFKEASYDGWVSIEILPKPTPDVAAKLAAEKILPLIEKYNFEMHSVVHNNGNN